MKEDISYEQMRTLVIESLKRFTGWGQIPSLQINVATLALSKEMTHPPSQEIFGNTEYKLSEKYDNWILDIAWSLMAEGILIPRLSEGSGNGLYSFTLSEYGKTRIQSEPPQPYDPDGYLSKLRESIPSIDPVIISYLEESLKAFRMHCLLASTITLGCASEKAILILIDACEKAISDTDQKEKFVKDTKTMSIKKKHDALLTIIDEKIKNHSSFPHDLKENLANYLTGIFNIIRRYRNDAGHPSGNKILRDDLYALLVAFPTYLKNIYGLIDWLTKPENEI